ncbi:hypothetical protein GCM10023107_35700 [Actinoplanes octamycinicus]|nr:hypothetical protein Aoc01nite_28910 [Actinoplanes octamycinicus]
MGLRYRVGFQIALKDRKVRPDVVFPRRKVAVFLDGCFWHGCPQHGRMPTDPTGYWHAKLERNQNRDITVNRQLQEAGWVAVRIWEHELAVEAAARIEAIVRSR